MTARQIVTAALGEVDDGAPVTRDALAAAWPALAEAVTLREALGAETAGDLVEIVERAQARKARAA